MWFPRWDVIQAHTRATAQSATQFLDALQRRMPFPIRALQVDGGSEFAVLAGLLELAAAAQTSAGHVAKFNGVVERANRTHTEEF